MPNVALITLVKGKGEKGKREKGKEKGKSRPANKQRSSDICPVNLRF